MKPAIIFGLCFSISFVAQANTATETLVVTGTRTPKLLANSPVRVDVIDQETIARLSRGTLRQVLDVIPGVVVTRSRKDGYNVQLQGFDGDHVLILVNGQPLLAPTGSSVDLDQISVSNIQQIEVVHGAASVLYGSSAMGGVINIITDNSTDSYFQIDAEVDSYLENNSDQTLSKSEDMGSLTRLQAAFDVLGWHSKINLQYIDSPAYDFDQTTLLENGANLDKRFGSLTLSRDFSAISSEWKSTWFDESKSKLVSLIPGQSVPIRYLSEVEQIQHDIRIKGAEHWQVSGRYASHDETSGNTNGLRQTDIELLELDGQKVWMAEDYEWVSGIVIHKDKLSQTNLKTHQLEIDDAQRQSIESYLQWNKRWGDSEVLLGVRGQNDSDFGWHQALRASASQRIEHATDRWKLMAGLGQSYRVPNLKERFYLFDHSNLGYMIIGDDSLVPEEAISANLGVNHSMDWHRWSFATDLNFHYSDVTDLISTQIEADASSEAGLSIYRYQNFSQATLSGFDLSLSAEHDNWKYDVGYRYLHAVDHQDLRLSERPRHQVKFSVTNDLAGGSGQWQVYGVYQLDIASSSAFQTVAEDDSLIVNVVFQYNVFDSLTLRFGIENLFDSHQSPQNLQQGLFDARGASSRRVYSGLTYRFDH